MDARGLVRSVRVFGTTWRAGNMRAARRRRGTDEEAQARATARAEPEPGVERARVPGNVCGAEPGPGGGLIRFERSSLRVRVAVGGILFCGWDGAEPEPSYVLAGACPDPDARTGLEPDKDGGWRVVSERLLLRVDRRGGVQVRTPGGVLLRREQPPRWWQREDLTAAVRGRGEARWLQRTQVAADARFFGLDGPAAGVRLAEGTYGLGGEWRAGGGGPGVPRQRQRRHNGRTAAEGPQAGRPVLLVRSAAGTHVVCYDTAATGRIRLGEGEEGRGSGHDRPGRCELRMAGGPLRSWVLAGPAARVLQGWRELTEPTEPPG